MVKKFNDVETFSKEVNDYFDSCDEKGRPYTITGLCIYLDFTRQSLCNYEKDELYFDTIKKAKQRVENYVEEYSLMGKLNPAVSIFNLKNNFGWKDKHEIETNQNITTSPYKELTTEELKKLAGD